MAWDIVSYLLKQGRLTPGAVDELADKSHAEGKEPADLLVDDGVVAEAELLSIYSHAFGLPVVEQLDGSRLLPEFRERVPQWFAVRHKLVGLKSTDGTGRLAIAGPDALAVVDDVVRLLGRELDPVFAPRALIASLISEAYAHQPAEIGEAIREVAQDDLERLALDVREGEDLVDVAAKPPVVKLVHMILLRAIRVRASDVHIQPYEDALHVRYRIDGVLYDVMNPPKGAQEAITSRIKVMGKMDIAERRLPQEGRTTLRLADREVDVRISCVPTCFGERVVMRLHDKGLSLFELEDLGMPEGVLETFQKLIHSSHGVIFVTGPTGCGKTTTLYAALKRINSPEKNIITIEDPIEYRIPGISQIEEDPKKGVTFANTLPYILRQDPDIIMIGEVRDYDTARIVIQASLTGHLVFSTAHTNDSATAITRLLDIGVEPYLVSSSLLAVLAQRLVRVICPRCKEKYQPTPEELELLGLPGDRAPVTRLWRGAGCPDCLETGYLGRTGIYELLLVDETVRAQIASGARAAETKRQAVERGLRTLRSDAIDKVLKGITTVEEIYRMTQMDAL
jgi:general secretion pathway protein E